MKTNKCQVKLLFICNQREMQKCSFYNQKEDDKKKKCIFLDKDGKCQSAVATQAAEEREKTIRTLENINAKIYVYDNLFKDIEKKIKDLKDWRDIKEKENEGFMGY